MRLALITAALCLIGPAASPGATAPRTHVVTIDASRFEPSRLTVAPGDTVVWKNVDLFPHTATSKTGAFDSKAIEPGGSWKFVAEKNALFDYVCSLHPTMTGSLRVSSTSAR